MRRNSKPDPKAVRETFSYLPDSGRLVRIKNKTAGTIGRMVGHIEGGVRPYRRIPFCNSGVPASWMVWAWHRGEFPGEPLIHLNGDTLDDRIENLAKRSSLRRPVQVAMALVPDEQPETMLGDLQGALNTGIYQITNIKNGRKYVGSAVNISKRWREHLRQLEDGKHHSRFMQRCWNKHGGECFVFRVILCCNVESLIWYEQRALDALRPEYNSAPKAGSQLGYKHSAESRKKMSASRPKDFSPMTGKRHSEETKRRISKAKKGVKLGAYSRERVSKASAAMRATKSVMNEDKVRLVRALRRDGSTYLQIANQVGCSWYVVSDIIQGRTFKWVT